MLEHALTCLFAFALQTALFVTWNKHSGPDPLDHRLRGCIGTLAPRMLHTALKDYALTAALRDSRFSPVSRKELPQLSCKVRLVTPPCNCGGGGRV